MNETLRAFAFEWLRVALMTLLAVAAIAFVSVPLSLGRYPGDPAAANATVARHMT